MFLSKQSNQQKREISLADYITGQSTLEISVASFITNIAWKKITMYGVRW